jgi:hypothetical protein
MSALAVKLYAKQSKDKLMMADATALKDRATRRLGELMEAQRKTVGLAKGAAEKRGLSENPRITLTEIGVDKNLANQARKRHAEAALLALYGAVIEGGAR